MDKNFKPLSERVSAEQTSGGRTSMCADDGCETGSSMLGHCFVVIRITVEVAELVLFTDVTQERPVRSTINVGIYVVIDWHHNKALSLKS